MTGISWEYIEGERMAEDESMIGGPGTSFPLELLVYLAAYKLWKGREVSRMG